MSAVSGLLIAGLSLTAAWLDVGRSVCLMSSHTYGKLLHADESVGAYRAKLGSNPGSLNDLPLWPEEQSDRFVDAWGRPLLYRVENGKPLISSLGADGKPGGSGCDQDISNQNRPFESLMPLSKFLTSYGREGGAVRGSIAGGVVAAILTWRIVSRIELVSLRSLGRGGARLAVTLLGSFVLAFFMAVLEYVGSGH